MLAAGECRDCGAIPNPEYYLAVQCFGRTEEGRGRTSLEKYGEQNPRTLEFEKNLASNQIQADLVKSGYTLVKAGIKRIIDGAIFSKSKIPLYANHPCKELAEIKVPKAK